MFFDSTTTTQPIRREDERIPAALSVVAGVVLAVILSYPAPVEQPRPAMQMVRSAPQIASVATIYDALSQCSAKMKESERWRVASAIHQESRRYGYDPLFVEAMVEVESQCKPTARGSHGAVGLIQIRPATAKAV